MKSAGLRIALLLGVLVLIVVAIVLLRSNDQRSAKVHSSELEYLKAVNGVVPPKDPELMFILMGEFGSSNLQDEGADFFSARLKEFEPQLTPVQKSLYLGIIGLQSRSECVPSATAESPWLCKRHDRHPRPDRADVGRAGFRRELDRWRGARRTS